ncbi:U3 small nucleolar RNA-associated protein 4 homolog isoform X2 [Ornithodoros turicata]|uniref:U3 small nucleolar RNA-associated protein 4 homolog isoform X2 n=1 Tax=Ornithodoros turicata TaxID=34597 RepID=UPI0031391545
MKRSNPSEKVENLTPGKTKYRVHKVRFYQPSPKSINVLSYDGTQDKVAVVRADFSIELWNLKYTPCIEGVIPSDPDTSIEAAAWFNGMLFTTGLNAHITQYNLATLQPKYSVAVTSGPGWCLAVNRHRAHIAAGTEEGYVCIFEIDDSGGLNFYKTLDKQDGRILSLAWHVDGNVIVTGSADVIRIWDVESGHTTDRILVGRAEKQKETLVWCLAVTNDFTIISGDSSGRTSFWDLQTTTQIDSFKAHNADVLTLTLTDDERRVFTSGIDPLLMEFTRVSHSTSKAHSWVKSTQKTIHTHDVRALVFAKNCIISGGVDTYLVFSSSTMLTKHFPKQHSALHLSCSTGHLLLNYKSHVDLWRLGSSELEAGSPGKALPLSNKPLHIAQVKAKRGSPFVCAALSNDCKWLACSSLVNVHLYSLQLDTDNSIPPVVQKVMPLIDTLVPSSSLLFTSDSSKLVVICLEYIQIWKLECAPVLVHTFPPSSTSSIHLACVSSGNFLATADGRSNINVYDLSSLKLKCKLPMHNGFPTVMKFAPDSTSLIVVYSDNRVVEFSVATSSYTSWYQKIHAAGGIAISTKSSLTGIAFDPKRKSLIMAYNDHELFIIDKEKELQARNKQSGRKASAIRRNLEFKWLLMFDSLHNGDMVAVEVPPAHILQQLPPPLWQKKYGT